jgi:hypothetical protein
MSEFTVRDRRRVWMGPFRVDILSNEARFVGMRNFPASCECELAGSADYTLHLCNLNIDGPWSLDQLAQARDRSYRGGRFAAGYYITDHFGSPAYLTTRGSHYWVFGTDLERILWPYFVKLLLTLYAMDHEMLHLKAAGAVVEGAGTLLVGRGGSGKTVLLTRLCQRGARFLSNTHVLIDGKTLLGVPAAMRIRRDALFGPLIEARQLKPGIKQGEYVADPLIDLQWPTDACAPLRNICLVDYRGPGQSIVTDLDRDVLLNYMEQFSLALNVYGLKEDVLDHLGGNLEQFSRHATRSRLQLQELVDRSRRYYVSCDATDHRSLDDFYSVLSRVQ